MNKESKNNIKSYVWAALSFILLVAADQGTKSLAVLNLKGQDAFVLIPGVFELRYLENRGAAFGLFQGRQFIFLIIALFVCLLILFLYRRIPAGLRFLPLRVCAVLLSAGAVGNMIDRVRLDYVVDFLYFKLIDFPIFNVADCYVVVSCVMFMVLILFVYKEDE